MHRGGHPPTREDDPATQCQEAGKGRLQVHVPPQILRVFRLPLRSRVLRARSCRGALRRGLRYARRQVTPSPSSRIYPSRLKLYHLSLAGWTSNTRSVTCSSCSCARSARSSSSQEKEPPCTPDPSSLVACAPGTALSYAGVATPRRKPWKGRRCSRSPRVRVFTS